MQGLLSAAVYVLPWNGKQSSGPAQYTGPCLPDTFREGGVAGQLHTGGISDILPASRKQHFRMTAGEQAPCCPAIIRFLYFRPVILQICPKFDAFGEN